MWNPALSDGFSSDPQVRATLDREHPVDALDRRWSVNHESAHIAARLVVSGMRTLVFCRSRRSTELVAAEIRRRVEQLDGEGGGDPGETIRSYRGGYLAEERRAIEEEMSDGTLRCIVATTALELGVDIGGVDAVVLSGYPGTISSFWQQVGRAGRHGRPSLSVFVAGQDQLDQWMARNPAELFHREPEPAVINADNPSVFVPHLACAAQEQALRRCDEALWPEQLDEAVRRLVLSDRAAVRRRSGERVAVWTGRGLPAPTIGLRSSAGGEIRIRDLDHHLIGTVETARAPATVHPGAVYLHQGRPWKVLTLDLGASIAVVEPTDGGVYTVARSETSIKVLGTTATRDVGAVVSGLADVEVTSRVLGYQARDVTTHEVIDRVSLDMHATDLLTKAVWYLFDDDLVGRAGVADGDVPGALHAVEHAAIGMLPLFTICDRWDVGGVSDSRLPDTGGATVVIHDAHAGGTGIAELAFDAADRHLAATLRVIEDCDCHDGCPSCIQSPKCGNGNAPLVKVAAAHLLRAALHHPQTLGALAAS